jgi:hypothetical protein
MEWVQLFMQMMGKGESAPQQSNPGEAIAGAVELVSSIFTAMGKVQEVMEASHMRFLKNIKLAQGIQISEVTPPTEVAGGEASE